MAEISFYHLINSTLEEALPVLLKKTLDAGKRAVVMAETNERLETLSSILWTAEPDSWIPHGSLKDGHLEHQPIWLTTSLENPNKATYLFFEAYIPEFLPEPLHFPFLGIILIILYFSA